MNPTADQNVENGVENIAIAPVIAEQVIKPQTSLDEEFGELDEDIKKLDAVENI